MLASIKSNELYDKIGSLAVSALWGIDELPLVRVINPTVVPNDPNANGLSPTSPLAIQWPSYGHFVTNNAFASILGVSGAQLQGRYWYYEPAIGKWMQSGNSVITATLVIDAAQGSQAAAMRAGHPHYFQPTSVTGTVTDLFYGFG